jgi:hypothetical protein
MFDNIIPYLVLQSLMVCWALYWWMQRQDEQLLLISGFFLYCGSFRAAMLALGLAEPVVISGGFFVGAVDGDFVDALELIVLGEVLLVASYSLAQGKVLGRVGRAIAEGHPTWLVRTIFALFMLIFPVAFVARRLVSIQVGQGRSLAFEVSGYLNLWPMGLVGVAILLLSTWRFGLIRSYAEKCFTCLILGSIVWFTYGPNLRFLFLGWFLAAGLIWSATAREGRRYWGLLIAVVLTVVAFGAAGALRYESSDDGIKQATFERITSAEDANMLDGFVMLRQVFPALLSYSWGGEHFAILTRVIPRSIWPDKPVGGYMNRLGFFDRDSGGTTGISPSLFGTFYQEGGVLGVIFLSSVYGFGLGRLISWADTLPPFNSVILRACVFAALIPLMRCGDLPGVYSWLGMSFWPCLLVLWLLRCDRKKSSEV